MIADGNVITLNCVLNKEGVYKELRGILVSEIEVETVYVDKNDDEVCISISVEDTRLESIEHAAIRERREFKIGNTTYIILIHFKLATIKSHELKDLISASDLIEAAIKDHYE